MGVQSNIYQTLAERFTQEQPAIVAGTLLIAAVVGLSIWRLCFHQLARFPGPKMAALIDYYVTYYDLVKNDAIVQQLEVLHRRYGRCMLDCTNGELTECSHLRSRSCR
jgi:hypothetical protein